MINGLSFWLLQISAPLPQTHTHNNNRTAPGNSDRLNLCMTFALFYISFSNLQTAKAIALDFFIFKTNACKFKLFKLA